MSGQVDIVAVTYRDRLARFGLEHLFGKHDVRVEVVIRRWVRGPPGAGGEPARGR